MKPFFGIDLTTNKKNEQLNGMEFLLVQPSPAMTQAFERASQKANETTNRAQLPPVLRIAQWISGAVGGMIAVGILRGMGSVTLQEAYQNAGALFWIAGGCLLIWTILKLASIHKAKTVMEKDESTQTFSNLEGVCKAIYSELGVPADAKEVDILSFFYKVKDGNIKVCEKGMQIAQYLNPIFKVFTDSENLYIANLEGKYAIPLSSLVSIRTVKKHIRIAGWNKDEEYNKGIYKQHKLTLDQYGCIHCKCYYILELNHNGESWGIYIPPYELPAFEALTGLKAE